MDVTKNADRFTGFADIYDDCRPRMPAYVVEIIEKYLGASPDTVVDMGCGTGLSTLAWQGNCRRVIGVDPGADMLKIAVEKQSDSLSFVKAFSHDTGLPDGIADAVICSQSFHWMEPAGTLAEVDRILKPHGVFTTVDCDWPPVCNWQAECSYEKLSQEINRITEANESLKNQCVRWDKKRHLENLKKSGIFTYVREIVFSSREECTADRLVRLAMSQGGLQAILKTMPGRISEQLDQFSREVHRIFGTGPFPADFGYRMRIGVKTPAESR